MTRVALYARYSSDNQRDASIEDQFRTCKERAMREKWTIFGSYKDAGISGASMILRPGIQSLVGFVTDTGSSSGWTSAEIVSEEIERSIRLRPT
jgi:DNA invertase Pin-like site-specific DNA recombinase